MGSPDRKVHCGAAPAAHHPRPGSGRRGRHSKIGMAPRHQRIDPDFSRSPHSRQRRARPDRRRIASSSHDTKTRWPYGDDQLPLPGRPFGQVILQRRVKRLHLPTPAASLHLRPPGHPPHHHPPSRAAVRRGGRHNPESAFGPPEGRRENLTPQSPGGRVTPPATRHHPQGEAISPSPLQGRGANEETTVLTAVTANVPETNEKNALISTRILTRRRLSTGGAQHAPAPRRRRRTRGFMQVASSTAAEKLHLSSFGHAYLGFGAVLIAVLFYLALAAQITIASYDMARLQGPPRQLIAEQDQLRYQEVTLHAPAQVQQQAAQSGMRRVVPSGYVAGQAVAIDLTAPVGAPASDSTPLWARAMAAVLNTVTRDVVAAGR